jgi:hypothetical protein
MHSSWTARLVTCAAAGAALALTLGPAAASAAVPAMPAVHPSVTGDPITLSAVSADSASDAWAVGDSNDVLHWNGTAWSEATALPADTYPRLYAVSAVSPTDVWAGGYGETGTLMLNWNGTSWSQVTVPGAGSGTTVTSISMDSATDGWATVESPFELLHWNGTAWSQVSVSYLPDVADALALSPTQAWVMGGSDTTYGLSSWNGTTWSEPATIPGPGLYGPGVEALGADSPTDLWAVGQYAASNGEGKAWAAHYNGTTWTQTPVVDPGESSQLTSVAAISPTDAWAVGYYKDGIHQGQTLALHWNGTKWTRVTTPDPGAVNEIFGVAAVSANNVWAVGEFNAYRRVRKTLILNWDGTSWTQS